MRPVTVHHQLTPATRTMKFTATITGEVTAPGFDLDKVYDSIRPHPQDGVQITGFNVTFSGGKKSAGKVQVPGSADGGDVST